MKRKRGDDLAERATKMLHEEVRRATQRVEEEERFFHRATGAQMTLEALLRVGAIHPDCEWFVRDWMKGGGMTDLAIGGENIIPGRLA